VLYDDQSKGFAMNSERKTEQKGMREKENMDKAVEAYKDREVIFSQRPIAGLLEKVRSGKVGVF
jgi:hypothetical protein